jgi:hypothetical protein
MNGKQAKAIFLWAIILYVGSSVAAGIFAKTAIGQDPPIVLPQNPTAARASPGENSWDEWRNFVLFQLKELSEGQKKIAEKLGSLEIKIAGIAASVTLITTLVLQYVKNKMGEKRRGK